MSVNNNYAYTTTINQGDPGRGCVNNNRKSWEGIVCKQQQEILGGDMCKQPLREILGGDYHNQRDPREEIHNV